MAGRTLRTAAAALGLAAVAVPMAAQGIDAPVSSGRVASAGAAVLRGLDKVAGDVSDIDIRVGETRQIGRLQITLGDCRYPVDNPAGDAFAYLVIRDAGIDQPRFSGWMVASSPALNALEDPRYDVWVMRCNA